MENDHGKVATADSKMKNLSSLVSIVVVTSPIESNPSTQLLDRCLSSIFQTWPSLIDCPIVVAADGCREQDDEDAVRRRKRVFGKASAMQLQNYHEFLDRLQARPWMIVDRPTPTAEVGLSTEWLGFALTLKKAIETHVTTPLVFVTPHDYELDPVALQHVGVQNLVDAILFGSNEYYNHQHKHDDTHHPFQSVNYIGLHNAKTLSLSQRNASALKGLSSIALESIAYNPPQVTDEERPCLSLQPLASWKENPHFASVQAYRDVVFDNTTYHRFKRGHFIEDTLGQQMLQALKDANPDTRQRQEIFETFGTFLLDVPNDDDDNNTQRACTFHINGLKYIDTRQREALGFAPPKAFEVERADAAAEFVARMNAKTI